jgi:hypothetical protein
MNPSFLCGNYLEHVRGKAGFLFFGSFKAGRQFQGSSFHFGFVSDSRNGNSNYGFCLLLLLSHLLSLVDVNDMQFFGYFYESSVVCSRACLTNGGNFTHNL